jgi:hypothetical protein
MIVSPHRPSHTAALHMLAHETAVPQCGPLDAELYQIGVYGIEGAQHNPSVFLLGENLYVNVRVLHENRSTNYIARVEDDWTLVEVKTMHPKASSVVRGPIRTPLSLNFPKCEDLRVFSWRNKLWAIGCTHNGGLAPSWMRQALLELSSDGSEIVQVHIFQSDRNEKNWMPCVDGENLSLVYSTDPLISLHVEAPNKIPTAQGIPQTLGYVRGGTQLVPFEGGWLALVHQVYKPPRVAPGYNPLLGGWAPPARDAIAGDAPVVYLHQFAYFDKDLTSVELGEPFYFVRPGVEFCAGLVRLASQGFVASFGVADKEAWLALFNEKTVKDTFRTS